MRTILGAFASCCVCIAYANQSSSVPEPAAQRNAAEPLELGVQTVDGDRGRFHAVLVTLHNSNSNTPFENLVVILHRGSAIEEARRLGRLNSAQSMVQIFAVPIAADGTYVTATYSAEHVAQSNEQVAVPPAASDVTWLPMLLPIVGTISGAVVGALLLHIFTSYREHARAGIEWQRMLFDKYENSYVRFLHNWDSSASASVLATQFRELHALSLVPGAIVEAYRETISILENDASSPDTRNLAAVKFRGKIEAFLRCPWV